VAKAAVASAVASTESSATVNKAASVPEIDSCCGHDVYSGIPYDSELRTCCEDGSAASFSDAGGDPCMSVGFDIEDGFGDYSFKKK
jgi:hypothetical protein